MKLTTEFSQRNFTLRGLPGLLNFSVESLGWLAQGGCDKGSIRVTSQEAAPAPRLWGLLDWLRCPVAIYDAQRRPVWWGFVNESIVQVGPWRVGATLEGMANRVMVFYSYKDGAEEKNAETTWAENTESVAEYGTFEYSGTLGGLTSQAAAEGKRGVLLEKMKWPQSKAELAGGEQAGATLSLKGWVHSLKWRAGIRAASGDVINTTQIANLVTDDGEFLTGTDIFSAGTIATSDERKGENRTYTEIMELLDQGGPNGRRLLATVTPERRLQVIEEAVDPGASGAVEYQVDRKGRIYTRLGQPVEDHLPPVGKWVQLKDVIPGSVDVARIGNPTVQFVDGAEWSASGGLRLQFRGQPRPEDLLKVQK